MATSRWLGRVPLFDRLVDLEPLVHEERPPLHTLDRAGLQKSVRRELERLLNTRSPLPAHHADSWDPTVIDYGLPDFTALSAESQEDRALVATLIARAVSAFEPRLAGVKVSVERPPRPCNGLALTIEASLVAGSWHEPVSFRTLIDLKAREAKLE